MTNTTAIETARTALTALTAADLKLADLRAAHRLAVRANNGDLIDSLACDVADQRKVVAQCEAALNTVRPRLFS